MGIARGPNIVRDGLVFGYDTGYGVANNNTATRFYPGQPAVNLLNYDTTMPIWPSNSSNMATLTSKTSARSFTVIGTCNVPGSMTFVYPSITTNATYHTISATFTNNSTETSNVALYIRGANNATSTVNQSQTTTMQPGQSIRKTLIGNVLTVNGGYTAAVGVWSHGTSGQVNMNVTDIQFEETTHATPFVDGTRSSTQSLIDLKKTADIDVSNISFDSTGQPVWDGTNDRSDVTSHSAIEIVDNVSIEYVYKRLSTDPVLDVIANKYHSTGWELFCTTASKFSLAGRNGDGTYYSTGNSGQTMVNNKFYHLVAQKEGTSWRLFVNGELDSSTTANSVGTWSNTGVLQIGGEGNGYFPHMELPVLKVYNRVLSTAEIKQNYKAYKNRFNI
jgi:hypothetical protein